MEKRHPLEQKLITRYGAGYGRGWAICFLIGNSLYFANLMEGWAGKKCCSLRVGKERIIDHFCRYSIHIVYCNSAVCSVFFIKLESKWRPLTHPWNLKKERIFPATVEFIEQFMRKKIGKKLCYEVVYSIPDVHF